VPRSTVGGGRDSLRNMKTSKTIDPEIKGLIKGPLVVVTPAMERRAKSLRLTLAQWLEGLVKQDTGSSASGLVLK